MSQPDGIGYGVVPKGSSRRLPPAVIPSSPMSQWPSVGRTADPDLTSCCSPLGGVVIRLRHSRIHANDCAECVTKNTMLDQIAVEVEIDGALTAEQRARLLEAGEKCPVHRTLKSEIDIRTTTPPSTE